MGARRARLRTLFNAMVKSHARSAIVRRSEYQRTLVRKGATLGANSTIVCGVTIGEYAFVGAGAVVTKDVAPYALMTGVPARRTGWMSAAGHRLTANGNLPDGRERLICEGTGELYGRDGERVSPIGVNL